MGHFEAIFGSRKRGKLATNVFCTVCLRQYERDSKRANIAMDAAASLEDALLKHKEYFPAEL